MSVPWLVHQGILTAFSFIAFLLVSVPLYWHLEAWNIGCVLYIAWTAISNLMTFVNCVIWRDNALILAPVWGDIVVRFQFIAPHGILAASLVINRRLYKIASTSSVSSSRAERRRVILTDLAIGLTPPIATLILFWFMQGHRYNIFGGIGPIAAIPNTYIAMVFTNGVSTIMGVVSATYSISTLRVFFRRRRQFSELLASNSNLTFNRYFRLMALAGIELCCTIPLSVFLIVYSNRLPIYQWAGLADLHSGFSRIEQYPALQWLMMPGEVMVLTLQQWLVIACSIIFFMFFGLAEEARTHYRLALTSVAKKLGYTSAGTLNSSNGFSPSKGSKLGVTIPSFIQRSNNRRSISSFSDKLSIGDFDNFEDLEKKAPYSPAASSSSSSDSITTPVDGIHVHQRQETKVDLPDVARPDSGIVVDVDIVTHRHSIAPDVPSSVRDSSNMV